MAAIAAPSLFARFFISTLMTKRELPMHQDECDVEQRLRACLELLERMEELLIGFQPMSAEEARHATKLPKDGGGDHVVAAVARQCASLDMKRADRDTTVDGM